MDWEVIKKFMDKHDCSHEVATSYFSLREDGCTVEQALLWCGLVDNKGEKERAMSFEEKMARYKKYRMNGMLAPFAWRHAFVYTK